METYETPEELREAIIQAFDKMLVGMTSLINSQDFNQQYLNHAYRQMMVSLDKAKQVGAEVRDARYNRLLSDMHVIADTFYVCYNNREPLARAFRTYYEDRNKKWE